GLLPGFGPPDRVDHHVGAVTVGEVLNSLHWVQLARVDRVGRAEVARPVQLLVVGIYRDDPLGPDQSRARDRGVPHTTAADHRDRVVATDRAGVDRGAQAGHHTAAQQPGHR